MIQEIETSNRNDTLGNPSGGFVTGVGLAIHWQDGPLGRGEDRLEPNGCFVETVLLAAKQRLEYYQASKFACDENAEAIRYINYALHELNERTLNREARNVEGTHIE